MYGGGSFVGRRWLGGGGRRLALMFCIWIWVGGSLLKTHQALSYMLESSTEINE